MDLKPSRRWLTPVLIGATAVIVLLAGYLLLVEPLRSVRTATATASGNPTGTALAPPHGTPGGPQVASVSPGAASPPPSPGAGTASGSHPSGVSMPKGDLPGWRMHFADDFSGTKLGPEWNVYQGQPSGDRGGYYDPSHVSVGGGMLTIVGSRDPSRGNIYATGGISNQSTDAQTYGRYEVRFRMDLGRGVAYALLLWPHTNQYPPEIDFAEDNGTDRQTTYASLHPANGGKTSEHSAKINFTQWHTAGMQWSPGHIVLTMDGKQWGDFTSGVPSEAMDLALQTQGWYCGHSWEACPDARTPAQVSMQVDWVVTYDRAG